MTDPYACTCRHPRLNSLNHCMTCGLIDVPVVRTVVLSKCEAEQEARSRRTNRVAALGPAARPDGDDERPTDPMPHPPGQPPQHAARSGEPLPR